METQLTFHEDDGMYWLTREPRDDEGHLPVDVEFDSIYDFAKTLSENEGAKEYFKLLLTGEKERIEQIINEVGSIRKALEIYAKCIDKEEMAEEMTEEDEYVLFNLIPFDYIDYLVNMTNNKEILDKYSYCFGTNENNKITSSSMVDTIIDDFAKKYLNNEEYEQFILDDSTATDLWFKYHEALIQEAIDFEME